MADKKPQPGMKEIEIKTIDSTSEPKLLSKEWLKKWSKEGKGIINGGEAICNQPPDQKVMMNATTPYGQGNLLYMLITYTMPKLHYNLEKVEEHMAVSPAYPEMYGRIVAKKREIEGQIKSGLASAAQAVADYELLKHDERKYREILDYFKEGKKDEHVLRALFIDRIDAHTGEGYSMISMTKRWPTIITDFIRMSDVEKDSRDNPDKIRKKLSISKAEAVVLKTKDKVFEEWKEMFFPDIKERYSRIKTLVEARRKSIDEYREWLKPYVASLKMMRDTTEINPSEYFTTAIQPWLKPDSMYFVRVYMWKTLTAEEVGKPGLVEGEIDPYDDFVKRHIPQIEKNYGIKIVETPKDKEKLVRESLSDESKHVLVDDDIIVVDDCLKKWNEPENIYESDAKLHRDKYYYAFYDLEIVSPLFKTEGGKEEIDDWNCLVTAYLISQNVLMLILLEVEAKKKWLNKYVKEIIGVREVEDKIRDEVEKRYGLSEEGKKERFAFISNLKKRQKKLEERWNEWLLWNKPKLRYVLKYFMRIGPYETVSKERLTKMYGRYMGGAMTDPFVKYLKQQFGKLSGLQPP